MNSYIRDKLFPKRTGRKVSTAQGLVEFALILPVLLMLVFVLIEIARVLHAWLAVENGARVGVRYAVTAEYNPEYCGDPANYDQYGQCNQEPDESGARVGSIHDAAWSGSSSIVRSGFGDVNPDDASYFNVVVCDPDVLVVPGATFDTHQCPGGENPGDPGDQVIVVVEFNHPLILPGLNAIWPQLRLTARREATVETYRIPPAVGTAPAFSSPTPRPSNTPDVPGPTHEVCKPWNVWHGSDGWDNDTWFGGYIYERHGHPDGPVVNEIILRNVYILQEDTNYKVNFINVGLSSNVQTIGVNAYGSSTRHGYVTAVYGIDLSLPIEDPSGEYYRLILLEAWFDHELTSNYYHIEGKFEFPESGETCYLNISAEYNVTPPADTDTPTPGPSPTEGETDPPPETSTPTASATSPGGGPDD